MSGWPTVTGSGESVFTSERSAETGAGSTTVISVSESLVAFGSAVVASTDAVFERSTSVVGVTLIVTVTGVVMRTVPRLQVTVVVTCVQLPWLATAEPNVTFGGRVSVSTTPVAGSGPALATVIVYVSSCPTCTGSGKSVLATERSADGAVTVIGAVGPVPSTVKPPAASPPAWFKYSPGVLETRTLKWSWIVPFAGTTIGGGPVHVSACPTMPGLFVVAPEVEFAT